MDWVNNSITDDKGKYLYKFLSKKHLELFLNSGSIWFSRADKFGDKLECVTIQDLKKEKIDIKKVKQIQRQHLIACFHEATNETLAFWDTYSQNEDERRVFALKFQLDEFCKKIIDANIPIESHKIKKRIHGKVIYKNLLSTKKETLEEKKVKYISLRKEYAFKYEREYRFVIKTKDQFDENGINIHLGNITTQVFEILVNPLLENEPYFKLLDYLKEKDVFDKFSLTKITKFFKPELTNAAYIKNKMPIKLIA